MTDPMPGQDRGLGSPHRGTLSPRHLYLEAWAQDAALTQRLLSLFPASRVYEIRDHRRLEAEPVPLKGSEHGIKQHALVLARHPGPWIRPFPLQPERALRAEVFIAHASGCPFDCEYCFLQGFLDHGAPVLFVNQEDLLQELADHLRENTAQGPASYHAGEVSDAFVFEPWTGFARTAISLFQSFPDGRLELRTKCREIEGFLPEDPPSNVIASWTVTPMDAWRRYEHGTPSPLLRLRSARACQTKGYQVGIRLDPALIYPDWEQGYQDLIHQVYEHLDPRAIESFVIGGLRYFPALARRIRERFPASALFSEEFIRGRDGRHRYFRPLRVSLYRKILQAIREHDPCVTVRLWMETETVRREVLLSSG